MEAKLLLDRSCSNFASRCCNLQNCFNLEGLGTRVDFRQLLSIPDKEIAPAQTICEFSIKLKNFKFIETVTKWCFVKCWKIHCQNCKRVFTELYFKRTLSHMFSLEFCKTIQGSHSIEQLLPLVHNVEKCPNIR